MPNYVLRIRIRADSAPVPVNTAVPGFLGTPSIGQSLASTNGVWANSPTSYTYQHQSSADGLTGWTDIVGATAQTLALTGALEDLYVRPGVKAANASGPATSFAHGPAAGPISVAADKLAPHSQWGVTGGAGTGWGGSNPAQPADPTRVTAKPAARLYNVPRQSFGADFDIIVAARARGGVASVKGQVEGGAEITVTTPAFHVVTDVNGNSKVQYGYKFTVDWAATMALNPLGRCRFVFTTTANNGAMQTRVISAEFSARNPGIGPGCVIDKELVVDATQADVLDTRYNTIVKALQRCVAHSRVNGAANPAVSPVWEFPAIKLVNNGFSYPLQTAVAAESFRRENWTRIYCAPGVSATVGDGSALRTGAGIQYDAVCFEGERLQWDLCKISPQMNGWRLRTNSNKLVWFNGCEVMAGDNNFFLGSGSGMGALYDGLTSDGFWVSCQDDSLPNAYFSDCYVHDIPSYGPGSCPHIVGNLIDGVGGSAHENATGLISGNVTRRVGGILSGLRTYLTALTLTYSGPGVANLVITNNVGRADRRFQLYVDGVSVMNMAISNVVGTTVPTSTKVANIAAAVNAIPGFTAVETSQPRAASFLTREVYQNASPTGAGPAPNGNTVYITTTPLVLSTWVDVHAEAFVWHGSSDAFPVTFSNVIAAFNEVEELVGGALFALNSNMIAEDFFFSQTTCHDTSNSYGMGFSGGYISAQQAKHAVIEYVSQAGGAQNITQTWNPDAYSAMDHCHLNGIAWSTRTPPTYPAFDIASLSIPYATLGLPVGSDANSKVQASGLGVGAFFTDLSDAGAPNFTPLAPLQLSDGTWAGAKLPNGDWNGL